MTRVRVLRRCVAACRVETVQPVNCHRRSYPIVVEPLFLDIRYTHLADRQFPMKGMIFSRIPPADRAYSDPPLSVCRPLIGSILEF